MNNEKNTQNAVAPMKDTRQYKHTPSKIKRLKRLKGKIFALVGCLAVLLSCLALPASADTITESPDIDMLPAPFHMPARVSLPYHDDQGSTYVFSYTIPYAINWSLITDEDNYPHSYDWFTEYEIDGISLNVYNEVGGDLQYGSYFCYSEITGASSQLDDDHVVLFEYDPFNYDPSVRRFLPGTNNSPVDNFMFGFSLGPGYVEGTEYSLFIDYDLYVEIPTDEGWQEANYNLTYERVHNTRYSWDSIELDNFFRDCGIIDDTFRVTDLAVTVSAGLSEWWVSDITCNYLLPVEPTISGVIQVVNTRDFTDLLDWLGDVLEGFLGQPLFSVGNLEVSIGTIIATIFGVLFVFLFLRFFSGG